MGFTHRSELAIAASARTLTQRSRLTELDSSRDLNAGAISSVSSASQLALPGITLTPFVSGFSQPTEIANAGDGTGRLFVVERNGHVRIVQNGAVLATPFLDISTQVRSQGQEQGLLGLAFAPDYASSGYFYVNYINSAGNTVIARFHVSSNPNVANAASEEIVLTIAQPFANHNGGKLAFGPDGYLYIGMGDGGGGGDPQNLAQNPNSLLGKILRIDVNPNTSRTYTIPASNPFLTNHDPQNLVRDEIWALGLRNPWRFSFDRLAGDLYIADVGQDNFEEVDFQRFNSRGGENYGWSIMEGFSVFKPGNTAGLIAPVVTYNHTQGESITGGFVYRGPVVSPLQGAYLYADFVNGKIWGVKRNGTSWQPSLLLDSPYNISTFGEDEAGNLYIADFSNGGIYRLGIPASPDHPGLIAWRNDATGEQFLWRMNGTTATGTVALNPPVPDINWQIQAAADFTGDGQVDLVWRNQATGAQVFWQMNGTTAIATIPLNPGVPDINWRIVAAADFTGDGQADLLWRNQATGEQVFWQMNGTTAISTIPLTPSVPDPNWQIVAAADFTGDGRTDLVWRNRATGAQVFWQMNGTTAIATLPFNLAVPDTAWKIAGAADFTGDNQADILWRNSTTGEQVFWEMNRTIATSTIDLAPPIVDPNWQALVLFSQAS
ncbi:MAG: PQQ-dependent sugar dehydrogenase [Scytolyngbya sp. HA4215-MV1]|jgi:glucose/arabinose dehydrogenase|nr:PQQ-dependent sugar dehydrogenase [Scytolyngbya sp. HA4215-MV1]